ncbi:uncharacterized protein GIQ15_04901 [Arthroderma uncinatum]|uniref:uncharacterized protein n=1 Tax=Arthroderma uncinatum TaxID=74035 RepID=UPI00144A9E91|nr:uncharacterized protein GIQ15_04901 [Arthroderma uncinatum]KAF3482142.1 hypothetical protein GIQ15_04901 [Arthroderma uncinatum]
MNGDKVLVHALTTKFPHGVKSDSNSPLIENDNAVESVVQVKCSWHPMVSSSEASSNYYALIFVDVNISVQPDAGDHRIVYDQSTGLKELLTTVDYYTPLTPGASWAGRVLVVIPTRPGYLARTKCFQERFAGCADIGIFKDRTVFGQQLGCIDSCKLSKLLDGCVLMIVRPDNHPHLSDDATALEEVKARISFQWLVENKPEQKTIALIDGHRNLESFLPFYISATALGIKFVILDHPGVWISDPSMRHLYQNFIPVDMTHDDDFHIRIATAVKSYGHVDGVCAIATRCLAPVARAAAMLGLPTEYPDAIARASDKHETRLVAGGADPTALVSGVADLKNQIAKEAFIPQYPLIVKPTLGTGSEHVYKVETEAELLEGVRRTCGASGKKALIEAYIDGPDPGDNGPLRSDFWENTNVLPSKLPPSEYAIVRQKLHQILLQFGLKTGVFHLEARVQNSSMEYREKDGLLDLRSRPNIKNSQAPRCFLIEINPRPPGFPCVIATEAAYGVNMYDLHLLACLGDHRRFRTLAEPFEPRTALPNYARAWSQLVWLRADKGGICASNDFCAEVLQRLPPDDRALITKSACLFRHGDRIPEPQPGVVMFAAFFVATSRRNRDDVVRVSQKLQREFSIPVIPTLGAA